MGCKRAGNGTVHTGNREAIDGMFDKGQVKGATWQRKQKCASGNECGNFCDRLSLEPGLVPQCIDPETDEIHSSDLYADYKRRNFQCPINLF